MAPSTAQKLDPEEIKQLFDQTLKNAREETQSLKNKPPKPEKLPPYITAFSPRDGEKPGSSASNSPQITTPARKKKQQKRQKDPHGVSSQAMPLAQTPRDYEQAMHKRYLGQQDEETSEPPEEQEGDEQPQEEQEKEDKEETTEENDGKDDTTGGEEEKNPEEPSELSPEGQLAADQNQARQKEQKGDGDENEEKNTDKEADSSTKDKKDGLKKAMSEKIQKVTSNWLKQSWLNLIETFGLTYIYIFIHFVGHYLFRFSIFARPGKEFSPEYMKGLVGEEKSKELSTAALSILELIAFIVLSAIIGFIVLLIVIIIAYVIQCASSVTNVVKFFAGLNCSWK